MSGSNTSGSKTKLGNTPFLVFDPNDKNKMKSLNYCRFTNFLNNFSLNQKVQKLLSLNIILILILIMNITKNFLLT
ncbi:hypothetical protein [Spiroplasma endosymbiont of Amphibalanus improvisus]|uniref:hypothetical protein n=1 Tax=Spiroplasma endosymbiont of Amphibalanus improvisus TaxID=3066327 RepID=UPI00313E8B95